MTRDPWIRGYILVVATFTALCGIAWGEVALGIIGGILIGAVVATDKGEQG